MINLGLLMHDRRHIDRDLATTAQHILVVTAGAGVYEVDERLARVTKQRMIDIGIGTAVLGPVFAYIAQRATLCASLSRPRMLFRSS